MTYNGTGHSFEDYAPTTSHVDGNDFFLASLGLVAFSLFGLPLFVAIGKLCCRNGGGSKAEEDLVDPYGSASAGGGEDDLAYYGFRPPAAPHPPLVDKSDISYGKRCHFILSFLSENCFAPRSRGGRSNNALTPRRRMAIARGLAREERKFRPTTDERDEEDDGGEGGVYYLGGTGGCDAEEASSNDRSGRVVRANSEETWEHQAAWDDSPHTPLCSLDFLQRSLLVTTVCQCDHETRRLLRLAVPFTFSTIVEEGADLFILAVVSHTCGDDGMIIYIMVSVILGLSDCFTEGIIEAVSSLSSMAYGAYNYDAAGRYLQAACVAYVVLESAMVLVWGFSIDKVIRLMGFDESITALATPYVWLLAAANIIGVVNGALLNFLEVIGREVYANAIHCVNCIVQAGLVALLFYGLSPSIVGVEADLIILGIIMLACEVFFFLINIVVSLSMGWLDDFKDGIFREFSMRDPFALRELVKTALPLMFGGLLSYAEWEILIVFAAILGPAEAVTWGVLGCLWGLLESSTAPIAEAAEVRCAYHLAKGRPDMARLSAYKSMSLSLIASLLVTGAFVGMSHLFPLWLTDDTTIQAMLADLLPFVAVGNVIMNMGEVCCALVGAQGRYHLATKTSAVCSLLVTIPLGALMTAHWRIDLEGLTFAVIVGYTLESVMLTVILIMSDWKGLSSKIQGKLGGKGGSSEDDTESDDTGEEEDSLPYKSPAEGIAMIAVVKAPTEIEESSSSDSSRATQRSKIDRASEASKGSGASGGIQAPETVQFKKPPKRSDASIANQGSWTSLVSELSKGSEEPTADEGSTIGHADKSSERSMASRATQEPKTAVYTAPALTPSVSMGQMSKHSEKAKVLIVSHGSIIGHVDRTDERSRVSRTTRADERSRVSRATRRDERSRVSRATKASKTALPTMPAPAPSVSLKLTSMSPSRNPIFRRLRKQK